MFEKIEIDANDTLLKKTKAIILSYDVSGNRISARFEVDQIVQNVPYRYLVISPRYVDVSISEIFSGKEIVCGVTLVPSQRFNPSNPCDLSWWRGGEGFISLVNLVKH